MQFPYRKSDEEWRQQLTEEQYRVTRDGRTETPFSGEHLEDHGPGTYRCVGCHQPLFASEARFDSGTGWPCFYAPVERQAVVERVDRSYGMVRSEALCSGCGAHLGHVFDDGPPPTGLRYCINSAALAFEPAPSPVTA